MKSILVLFAIALSMTAFSSQSFALSCHSFGSFESFELTPPVAKGKQSGLKIVDMTSLSPQELILVGQVTLEKFKVKATQPTFRMGKKDMGTMAGEKQADGSWIMSWYPVGTSSNGSRRLDFTCEAQ